MASLGAPVTNNFAIGTAEVRLGSLSNAGMLTQENSIGVLDSVTVAVEQESVDLPAGFPQKVIATEIVSQEASLTAELRESSRRNIKILLGGGLDAVTPVEVKSLVVADAAKGAVTVDVTGGTGANFSVGDIVTIYPDGRPEDVTLSYITTVSTDELTLDTGLATAIAGSTETVHIYLSRPVAIGAITKTNHFSVMVLQRENSTGRPIVFQFWKAALSGSFSYETNPTDFSSNTLELKLLEPSLSEYASGGVLAHMAKTIAKHPTGLYSGGAD